MPEHASETKDVFISYAHKDAEIAKAIDRQLEAEGVSVWWDDDLVGGQHFVDVIQEALESSRSVAVLFSRQSLASRYVKAEALEAYNQEKLIPVLIEPVYDGLKTPFNTIHYVDLSQWNGRGDYPQFQELINAIRKKTGQKPVIEKETTGGDTPVTLWRNWRFLSLLLLLMIVPLLFFGLRGLWKKDGDTAVCDVSLTFQTRPDNRVLAVLTEVAGRRKSHAVTGSGLASFKVKLQKENPWTLKPRFSKIGEKSLTIRGCPSLLRKEFNDSSLEIRGKLQK